MTSRLALAVSVIASAGLVGGYVASGGGTYKPLELEDPCNVRPLSELKGAPRPLEQIALSGLDGAACALRVTREELALALASKDARDRFAAEHGLSQPELERAIRAGLKRAAANARRAGLVSGLEGQLLELAVDRVPVDVLLDLLRSEPGRSVTDLLGDLLRSSAAP